MPFKRNYGFWSHDFKDYLLSNVETPYGVHFSGCLNYFLRPVPSLRTFGNYDARQFYHQFAECVRHHHLEKMSPYLGSFANTLVDSWIKHCDHNNYSWHLTESKILNSFGITSALLCVPPDMTVEKRDKKILEGAYEYYEPRFEAHLKPDSVLHAVYWVHFVVKETWTLTDIKTGETIFTSPEGHPNHHLWKVKATMLPGEEPFYELIDFDNQVRSRIGQLVEPKDLLKDKNIDPTEVWALIL